MFFSNFKNENEKMPISALVLWCKKRNWKSKENGMQLPYKNHFNVNYINQNE